MNMNPLEFTQLKAFARQDGTILGLIWIASFACFIGEFSNPMLGMAALILAVISPFFVAMRLRKFRDNSRDGVISFRRALAYCILAFFYASLLFAIAQYVYFRYMDHGFLVAQYNNMFNAPEAKQMMKVMAAGEQIKSGINLLASLRPIEIVFEFLSMNISIGIILSVPIAALMKRTTSINSINKQQ
jgi:hypothetical protein